MDMEELYLVPNGSTRSDVIRIAVQLVKQLEKHESELLSRWTADGSLDNGSRDAGDLAYVLCQAAVHALGVQICKWESFDERARECAFAAKALNEAVAREESPWLSLLEGFKWRG